MSACLGGMIMPYFSELIESESEEKFREIIDKIEKTAARMISCKPQVLVLLSAYGAVVADGVTIHVDPRVKGKISGHALGCETEHLLVKAILNQSERLGIVMHQLTDDFLAENKLDGKLSQAAAILLYYLHKAGFKGQVVCLNYGNLFYEEMYTLGKAVQLAIDKVRKHAVIVVGAGLGTENDQEEQVFNRKIVEILENLSVKDLLDMAKNKPAGMEKSDFQALFFLLGSLSKLDVVSRDLYYQQYLGKGQIVGSFL